MNFDNNFNSIANRLICQDQQIDNSVTRNTDREPTPYFQCVNEGTVKVMSASFQESNQNSCPLQFAREQPVKTCTTNNYANQNVTVMMKRLYDLFVFFRKTNKINLNKIF
jgi:hypothetical protein